MRPCFNNIASILEVATAIGIEPSYLTCDRSKFRRCVLPVPPGASKNKIAELLLLTLFITNQKTVFAQVIIGVYLFAILLLNFADYNYIAQEYRYE